MGEKKGVLLLKDLSLVFGRLTALPSADSVFYQEGINGRKNSTCLLSQVLFNLMHYIHLSLLNPIYCFACKLSI